MEVALVQYYPNHGFEVWITNIIEVGEGLGDVFDRREEALQYARENHVPVVDLTNVEMPYVEGEELRTFLGQYLEISTYGEVLAIK